MTTLTHLDLNRVAKAVEKAERDRQANVTLDARTARALVTMAQKYDRLIEMQTVSTAKQD